MDTSEANLVNAFKTLKGEVHVHLEACELAGWVRRVIKPFVKRVVVSHPKTNAWIAKDPRKNDRLEFKQVVQQHGHLGQEVVALKLKIKSRLRQQGAVAHPMSDGKLLAYECLDRWSGNPKLKDVSRKAFLGAMRSRQENAFQRAYAASLKRTHDKTHARLNVQRKIVAVMRAIWKGGVNYQDDMGKGR